MKFISFKIFYLTAIIAVGISCKKSYLETAPTDAVSSATAFKTTANAWEALNGIHRSLYIQYYSNQDQGGQCANMIYMDMMGEDLVNTTSGNGWFISTYRWIAHRTATGTGTAYFNYRFYYTIIANANMIIENIDNADGPQADKNAIKGQAYTYRAWCYYQMIQLYGIRYNAGDANDNPGIPLVLSSKPTITPRSTVAKVYDQINKDLDQAISLLSGYNRANKSHLNLSVAQGIKARVALTQQNWSVAASMANAARQGYVPMSTADYMKGFNDYTNSEWMWGSHQQSDQTTYFFSFFAYMSADFNSTNIRTNPKAINSLLYAKITATDVRKQLWDPTGTNTVFPIPPGGVRMKYMNRKFLSGGGSSSSIGDVPNMRAAEMYLIEAEANARIGGQDAAAQQTLFDLVSKRDPSYVKSSNTGQALIDEILTQRRIELWGEGLRFYDLKRMNLPLDRTGANHDISVAVKMQVPVGDILWQFLIPQDEINNSGGVVVQNPL